VRGAMLDEGLAIVTGLWSGENFSFAGKHYQVKETRFLPPPVQQPRIPIWLAGTWPKKKPFRRAVRFDGTVPMSADIEKQLTPGDVKELAQFVAANRAIQAPFDIVVAGETPADDKRRARDLAASYADAGATWYLESTLPWKQPFDDFRRRIAAGPPK